MELILGTFTGIVFGFLLQKAEVLRFEKQVGFLLFKDATIIKFMFSAILTGMVGLYLLKDTGLIAFKIKSAVYGAQITGGILFGIGWAIFGYCPGTSVGALGEGRFGVIWGILGMIVGAGVYAHLYPFFKENVLGMGVVGKVTIPEYIDMAAFPVIVGFLAIGIFMFIVFEKLTGK